MRKHSVAWWLYQPYKFLVVGPALVVATAFFASLTLALLLLARPKNVSRWTGVPWSRLMARITPMSVEVEGREHIEPGQSYVIVSNHQSQYDIFVLYGWLGVNFKWVMKKELRTIPGIGVACDRLGHIYIDRSSRAAAIEALENAARRIVDGTSVVFFPEGTRSRSGRLKRFKKGAFRMAQDLGLPILPVTVAGTRDILPPGSTDLRPGSVRLVFHRPVDAERVAGAACGEVMDEVRAAIDSAL